MLPTEIIPVRYHDGRIDYLDTRERGPWEVARFATQSKPAAEPARNTIPPPF